MSDFPEGPIDTEDLFGVPAAPARADEPMNQMPDWIKTQEVATHVGTPDPNCPHCVGSGHVMVTHAFQHDQPAYAKPMGCGCSLRNLSAVPPSASPEPRNGIGQPKPEQIRKAMDVCPMCYGARHLQGGTNGIQTWLGSPCPTCNPNCSCCVAPPSSPERERAQDTDGQILHELRSRLAREAESLEQNLADVDRRDWGHARAQALAVIKGHCRVLKTWANGEVPVTRWREKFNESDRKVTALETRLADAEQLLQGELDGGNESGAIRAFLAESRR